MSRATRPTEKQVQTGIVKTLRMLGAAVYDTSQPHRAKITPGVPDLLVFHGDRFAFVEVKRPGGKLSDPQEGFRAYCIRTGTEHHVWESSEQAVQWIQGGTP